MDVVRARSIAKNRSFWYFAAANACLREGKEMNKRIILAADELTAEQLLHLMKVVGDRPYAVKIHNLFDEHGKAVIDWLKGYGAKVWVDAKLHDIPNTVGHRAAAIKKAGADILTVHASGGVEMMKKAKEHGPEEVYGVTVLTSLDVSSTLQIYNDHVVNVVLNLGRMASLAGLDGIVCSPQEVETLRYEIGIRPDMKFVTPGIRSMGKDANDQQRIATPGQAMLNGSSFLVIGRQITQAKDPILAIEQIEREIEEALSKKGI